MRMHNWHHGNKLKLGCMVNFSKQIGAIETTEVSQKYIYDSNNYICYMKIF